MESLCISAYTGYDPGYEVRMVLKFPDAAVKRTPGRDYLYHTELPRSMVSSAIAASLDAIDYDNFKNSVNDDQLHATYSAVWSTMSTLQESPPYASSRRTAAT